MRVKEAMSQGVIGVQESADLAEAVDTMLKANVSAVFVFNAAGEMVGILSQGDLLHRTELGSAQRRSRWLDLLLNGGAAARAYAQTHGHVVADVMTRFILSIGEEADIAEAIDLMTERHVRRLPVMRGRDVVGVLSRSDIVRALHRAQIAAAGAITPRSDSDISADLAAALAGDPWRVSNTVAARVEHGVVTLDGSVCDERVRHGLVVMAQNTPGVISVRDEMSWIEPNSGLMMTGEADRAV